MTNSNYTFDIALLDIGEPTERNIYPDMELDSKTFRYFCCKDGRDLHLIQPGAHYFFKECKKKQQYSVDVKELFCFLFLYYFFHFSYIILMIL